MNSIQITTSAMPDGKIIQEVSGVNDGVREQYMRTVLDTQEQQVRDALIAMGWTPPKKGVKP